MEALWAVEVYPTEVGALAEVVEAAKEAESVAQEVCPTDAAWAEAAAKGAEWAWVS